MLAMMTALTAPWSLYTEVRITDPVKKVLGQPTSYELIAKGINDCVDMNKLQQANDRLTLALLRMQARDN